MDLSGRSTDTEWMDTQTVSDSDYADCLRDLAQVNTFTLARRPTLDFLRRASARAPGRVLRVVDVGYGHGDMLRAIHCWGSRSGVPLALAGIDLNPASVPAARAATPAFMAIDYLAGDVFAWQPAEPIDVVISSLVAHHMDDALLARFVGWMEATARVGWFVNDLRRSAISHAGFRLLAGLAGWHRFVRHDGPVSIARSFRPQDWQRILGHGTPAPIAGVIEPWFPFRLCVSRLRDPV